MIPDITHPQYRNLISDWMKWRLAYEGGTDFMDEYLQKFSARESTRDFANRKRISYVPAFAKAAVDEVKNAIYQRIADVTREGGPDSYQAAVRGQHGGVDLEHATMTSFLGQQVLPELLVMKKVGIWVDSPVLQGPSLAEKTGHPYLYAYCAEDIRSWSWDYSASTNTFKSVLLRDWLSVYDEKTALPMDDMPRYRYAYLSEGQVFVEYFNEQGLPIDEMGKELTAPRPIALNLKTIPFVVAELPHSLMQDIADIQIALMNMASADVNFATKANFPFYIEQYDPFTGNHLRTGGRGDPDLEGADLGTAATARTAQGKEIRVGVSAGRQYPKGLEAPAFIHPSPEPLKASMEKQAQMKGELRQLVHLAVANLDPTMASAESKAMDERSLENGLSAIGLVLEQTERHIAAFWAEYEGATVATVRYPSTWSIQSEEERRKEAEELSKLMPAVPSKLFQKEVAKQVAKKMVGHKVSLEVWEAIAKEIDEAVVMTSDPDAIAQDVEKGLVSTKTASMARGYAADEAEKAKDELVERLGAIAIAQAPAGGAGASVARGTGMGNPTDTSGKDEKKGKPQRGEAKGVTNG